MKEAVDLWRWGAWIPKSVTAKRKSTVWPETQSPSMICRTLWNTTESGACCISFGTTPNSTGHSPCIPCLKSTPIYVRSLSCDSLWTPAAEEKSYIWWRTYQNTTKKGPNLTEQNYTICESTYGNTISLQMRPRNRIGHAEEVPTIVLHTYVKFQG